MNTVLIYIYSISLVQKSFDLWKIISSADILKDKEFKPALFQHPIYGGSETEKKIKGL